MMELEICVDSVESAMAAEAGGAQRVELCSALSEGGLTPSAGMLRAVRSRIGIGIYAMIRPRGGDFCYSDHEFQIMRDDIACAADLGAAGVVLGLLTTEARVDVERTAELVALARPMRVTFHRALDMAREMDEALEDVVRTGADRVLTSGGAQNAVLGSERAAGLVALARERIGVMLCGNVRPENVQRIAQTTGAREFHAALRVAMPSPVTYRKTGLNLGDAGMDEYTRHGVRAEDVRNLRLALDSALTLR